METGSAGNVNPAEKTAQRVQRAGGSPMTTLTA